MCGIAGYIGNNIFDRKEIENLLSSFIHRGPDYQSYFSTKLKNNLNLYFFHSRLSILDLHSRSNQPMEDEKGVLAFNGEIYNFKKLKNKLENNGIPFNGLSDTEVLLKTINYFGINEINSCSGMWSFAYFNKISEEIIFCRDRIGEKPFYYFTANDGFYFASEVNTLIKLVKKKININFNQLRSYLIEGYTSIFNTGETFFQNIIELEPASYLKLNSKMEKIKKKYWNLQYKPEDDSYENLTQKVRDQFILSVESRMVSDVPVCALLSGGVDSSSIVSTIKNILNKEITTFSVFSDDHAYSENGMIQSITKELKLENIHILNKIENPKQEICNLIKLQASPLSSPAILFNNKLFSLVKENQFKVSLMGTGGDEALTGYYEHFIFDLVERLDNSSFKSQEKNFLKYILPVLNNPKLKNYKEYFSNFDKRDHLYLDKTFLSNFINVDSFEYSKEKKYSNSILRNRMLNFLFNQGVRLNLHDIDLNSMQYSVENRAPLLDHKFLELCYSIPNKYLIKNGYAKALLRDAMRNITPVAALNSRNKHSLNVSMDNLFDIKSDSFLNFLFEDNILMEKQILNNKNFLVDYLKNKNISNTFGQILFRLLSAKEFIKIYD